MTDKKAAIDKDLIRDLAAILNETELTEIEVEQDNLRIRVSRQGTVVPVNTAVQSAPGPLAAIAPTAEATPVSKAAGIDVKSPMVGTAYLSPSPDADNFVKIGDMVGEGQTVLIVEAMKTMNQIPATHSGKVTAIMVKDGQPVEYGEPLLTIE